MVPPITVVSCDMFIIIIIIMFINFSDGFSRSVLK